MGTVGAGKTTFQHYTRHVSAAKIFEEKSNGPYPHWISVDFLGFTNDQAPVDYIYECLMTYILSNDYLSGFKSCIEKAYEAEINAIKKGPAFLISNDSNKLNEVISEKLQKDFDDKKPYVNKVLTFASSEAPVYLVIDNVDQLSEDIQSKIFTEAVAFAQKLHLNLVISIRNSTYVEHRNSAAFNAFDFDPILIEPPKVEAILSKRFFLARNLINGTKGHFISENGMRINVDNLSSLIELVQSSVLGTQVGGLLEVLAAGDIRNALRMTRHFLEHGYSNPGKAVQVYQSKGFYVLPRHEALRAILLGSHAVYSEEYSLIGNPFDARLGRTNLQMVRLFILNALVQYSTDPSFQYVDGIEIRKHMRSIGVSDNSTLKALNDLCKLRFIHTASHDKASFSSNYYPSRLGGYIVRELISNVTFVENIMMDTFISDEVCWQKLNELGTKISGSPRSIVKRLELRFDKIKVFYPYMNTLYTELLKESQKRNLPIEWKSNPFDSGSRNLSLNMEAAMASANKNYKPNQRR